MKPISQRLIASVLGATFLAVTPASAEDLRPQNFPQCAIHVLSDGTTICGYVNVRDWKLVLKADLDLTHFRKRVTILEDRERELRLQLDAVSKERDFAAKRAELYAGETERLTSELIALDKKYQDERVKPQWGSTLAWSIAGVSVSALVGASLVLFLD